MLATERPTPWLSTALALVAAVTLLRWGLLWLNRTDLFVDESQYWLQSRHLEWGTYSKPPLITWLIRATTELARCDSPFCIRLPAAALHGLTALILGAVAARRFSGTAAVQVTFLYLTLPFAALGSLLISTDTVMLPFFAAAIYGHQRLIESRRLSWAVLTGIAVGLALMAKYAAIYALLGIAVAAVLPGDARIGPKALAVIVVTSALIILPNLMWNASHQFATFWHTLANVGWVATDKPKPYPGIMGAVWFLIGQLGVFGPIMAMALMAALVGTRGQTGLKALAVVPLVVVIVQAMLGRAYGNWAVAAYLAGSLLAVDWFSRNARWFWGAAFINIVVALLLPVLTVFPEVAVRDGQPVLARYLGRADLSRKILTLAAHEGNVPIVADRRAVLADLFYTGRSQNIRIYARPHAGFPANYYQQTHALPPGQTSPVLLVGDLPAACQPLAPTVTLDGRGTYEGQKIAVTKVDPSCLFPAT